MDRVSEIFKSAGWKFAITAASEAAVRAVESRVGKVLPGSFRHFLSADRATEFLRENSNSDVPIQRSKVGCPLDRWDEYDPLRENLLPFMLENQAVCAWAVELKGDDPQVFVEVDSGSPPKWQLAATAFTVWLRCQVEDKLLMNSAALGAQGPALDDTTIWFLRGIFREGDTTFSWPGKTNHRFVNRLSRLLLWSGEKQCDWWVSLQPGATIESVLGQFDNVVSLHEAFYLIRDQYAEPFGRWKRGLIRH